MKRTCSRCNGHRYVAQLYGNICRWKNDALIVLPAKQAEDCDLFSEEDSELDYLVVLSLVERGVS